jgi:hypothetical protein
MPEPALFDLTMPDPTALALATLKPGAQRSPPEPKPVELELAPELPLLQEPAAWYLDPPTFPEPNP